MKSTSATTSFLLLSFLLIATVLNVAAAPPKCSTNQDCRAYCGRVGPPTPLCFDGVCRCWSNTKNISESTFDKAQRKSSNSNFLI
ncbi:hypothetical protein ACS0TY_007379 [Phlomoides rotata]